MNRSSLVAAARAARLARVRARNLGSLITHGPGFVIAPDAVVARGMRMDAGRNVSVGPRFTALANLTIGDDVMISAGVGVIGDDHPFDESDMPLTTFVANDPAHIRIEGDSLIGYGSTLLGSIRIGYGAIVGARSLVTRDVPPNAIVVGSPARVVGQRRLS